MFNKKSSTQRIGILGGTFNPPHHGHVAIAKEALKQLHLDFIVILPAFIPPHKTKQKITSVRHRITMLQLAFKNEQRMCISLMELQRKGISYTKDSIGMLRNKYPDATLFLIIGSDNLQSFHTWKSYRTILKHTTLAVYKRKGFALSSQKISLPFIRIVGKEIRVSSSDIRDRIADGLTVSRLVPRSIDTYIKAHNLYTRVKSSISTDENNCLHG